MLEYQTFGRVCINLEIVAALVRESKGRNLYLFLCEVKYCCLSSLHGVLPWSTLSKQVLQHCCLLLTFTCRQDCLWFCISAGSGEVTYFFSWWKEILRQPAFPLPLQFSPQMKYVQVFVSSVLLHLFINVVTSWNACLLLKLLLAVLLWFFLYQEVQ